MGTNAKYKLAWWKWSHWCHQREFDPIRCIKFILDFLSELLASGLGYSSIGATRSAISAYHDPKDGISVGEHPRVSSLMSGVFNERPPIPKYNFIWDVDVVLAYIRTFLVNDSISDKLISYKLVTLLALTAASRVSVITNLDINLN